MSTMTNIAYVNTNDCSLSGCNDEGVMPKVIEFPVSFSVAQDDELNFSGLQIGEAVNEDDRMDIKAEHSAEPIKNLEDLARLKQYLIDNKKFRDYLMLVVGINTGLRYSDFSQLKFSDLIDREKIGTPDPFKAELVLEERKTRNTKHQRVNRHIAINSSIKKAVSLYLENVSGVQLGDYLFANNARNKGNYVAKPITCVGVETNFKKYAEAIGLNIRFGSHTFRKTFGYQFMMQNQGNSRALHQLQQMFNHSSETITLRYIGITGDEIRHSYEILCL